MKPIPILVRTVTIIIGIYFIFSACGSSQSLKVRPAAVSGQFYPSNPQTLRLAIQQFLKDSPEMSLDKPIALIVPHAGYIYSGQICADAYRQVMNHNYDVIAILGVNHTTAGFEGISLGDYSAFSTPLGNVPVDEEIISELLKECSDCKRSHEVHVKEHSIEVQLPFLQVLFPKAKIIPAIIYPADYPMCERFGKALARVLKNKQALIIASSDLSHYPDYTDAKKADCLTLKTIASLDTKRVASLMKVLDVPNLETRACGEAAILAAMTAAKDLGATRATVTGFANSGDVPIGKRTGTVGYGSVVFTQGTAPSNTSMLDQPTPQSTASPFQDSEKKSLLAFAREAIRRYLTTQTVPLARNFPPRLYFPQGAFVTLKKAGQLRGCIGRLIGDVGLGQTVAAMALQAAFNDPRFPPVALSELKDLQIEISVLTPLRPIASPEEIVIGRDGVLMATSGTSAVFLPQVAVENNWDRNEMLENLCRKAGLKAACWKHDAQFRTFQAEVFSESR